MHLRRLTALGVCTLALAAATPSQADNTVTRGADLAVDATPDGRLAIDLLGDLWVLPGGGGDARQLTQNLKTVQRPKWSPDTEKIAFQATVNSSQGIWIYDFSSATSRQLTDPSTLDIQAEWHPDGERITFASSRSGGDFDLWEVDVPTGLQWRISDHDGDETDPAWSTDGRSLVYVSHHDQEWSLVLRQHGRREELLLTANDKLSAPSFRPDGSLITFFRSHANRVSVDMIILSTPRLVREFASNEAFVLTPISWFDRQHMVYAAGGGLRHRSFGSWNSRALTFSATVQAAIPAVDDRVRQSLEWSNGPSGELVIHASQLFDGLQTDYFYDKDIAIKGGRIASIKAHSPHTGRVVIDMGDLTVLPGFIDASARLPEPLTASHGPDLLTSGVTTVVAAHPDSRELDALWSGKTVPGPRLLDAAKWRLAPLSRPEIDVTAAVIGSRETGQTAGAALPTLFRTLALAGLTPLQSLRAIGVNAAAALLTDPFLGRIAPGAAADLVFVDGDPLANIHDALNVVAVVRNGRFYSVSGLIDRAKAAETVE